MRPDGPALVYETSGEIVPLGAGGLTVGRDTGCTLHIPDQTVSKRHAEVLKESGVFVVFDNGSTNGTFVNGIQVKRKPLADGDHVRFGTVSFRFRAMPSMVLEPIAPDRRLTRALEALHRLSTAVLARDSERLATRAVTDFLLDFLGADRVFVAYMRATPGREDIELATIRTRASLDPKKAVAPVSYTPMQQAVRHKRTFCPSTDPKAQDFAATSKSMRAASLGSVMVVPLVVRGKVLGAIQVERIDLSVARGHFDEVDVLTGELAANLLAGAIDSTRLYKKHEAERMPLKP